MTDPALIEKCREYRTNPTRAERLLWEEVRARKLAGYKFRRQHPLAGFIIDFYCVDCKIGIELDGEVHHLEEQQEYDQQRTEILSGYGVLVLRFWNSEVENIMGEVLSKIELVLAQRKSDSRLFK